MIRVGVIGYGYWGPNLVRNFMEVTGSTVGMVADVRPERLAHARSRYPAMQVTPDAREILGSPDLDAVVIATPVASHHELALQALRAGKHVLVEKPIAATADQALQLIDEAGRRNLVLMVDHTFVYTGAVRAIRELITSHVLGEVYYYDSVRVNLGVFQPDVNVLWDLAVHDLSIMDCVLPGTPCSVSATGISHIPGKPENVANMTLFYETNQIAHLHVNWLAPVKVRRTLIGGSDKMIVYDDLEPSEKVRIYDKGVSLSPHVEAAYEQLVSYRLGDMWAPRLDTTEALRTEALHFIACINEHKLPDTDGPGGLRIVRILEAAEQSLRGRGHPVDVRKA